MVRINSTKFGEVTIDKKIYYSDMTVYWDGKIEYRDKSHVFDMSEFLTLMQRKPEIIVIGTGQSGIIKVEEEVKQASEDKGVEIYTEITPKAIDIFNAFVSDKKRVIGVFHTTC